MGLFALIPPSANFLKCSKNIGAALVALAATQMGVSVDTKMLLHAQQTIIRRITCDLACKYQTSECSHTSYTLVNGFSSGSIPLQNITAVDFLQCRSHFS